MAYCCLKEIQQNLGLAQHRLKQDEPTQWNSTLYMLQTIKEQKMALAAYAPEYAIPQLTPNQLDLTSKVIAALHPIEEITKSDSTDAASASLIIPVIRILRRTLEDHEDDCGIHTMKREMLSSLNRQYIAVEANAPLVLATILDARDLLEAKATAITATQPSQAPEPSPKRAQTVTLNCQRSLKKQELQLAMRQAQKGKDTLRNCSSLFIKQIHVVGGLKTEFDFHF